MRVLNWHSTAKINDKTTEASRNVSTIIYVEIKCQLQMLKLLKNLTNYNISTSILAI